MKTLYAKTLSPICFEVEKFSTTDVLENTKMEYNSENAYAIVGLWKEGRKKILNFCSSVYKLVPNASILEPLIPVLEDKFKDLNISVSNDKDAQFTVRVAPVVPSFSPKSEVIRPAITFTNSYDGKVLAQATGGLVRYMTDKKGTVHEMFSSYMEGLSFSYVFKHSNENIYSMEGISSKIDAYIAEFKKVEEQIELMKQVSIKNAVSTKLEKLVRKFSKGTVFPLKEVEQAIERIQYESEVFGVEPNLWTIYNAMNYIVENSEASLTTDMRTKANGKIYANICEMLK